MRHITASIDRATQDRWLLGEEVPGVRFKMCQSVAVVAGPVKGKRGELITLLRVEPEPAYHLETEDGGDEQVFESEIERHDV